MSMKMVVSTVAALGGRGHCVQRDHSEACLMLVVM